MKLKTLSALTLAASATLTTSSAMAWESEDGAWSSSASVALSTDYVWRGFSQTDNEPAISGSFDVGHESGFYAGIWASNVDFNSDASTEIDYYVGYAADIGNSGFSYDIGALYYAYPSENELDWLEFYGSLSYSFLTASIAHSEQYAGDSDNDGTYYNLSAAYDLPGGFGLAAGIGYYDIDLQNSTGGDDYVNWSIGVSKDLIGFGFDLTYSDTDETNEHLADDRLIFTISRSM